MNEPNEQRGEGVDRLDLPAALVRLERAAGVPVPTGTLRLWSAELHGEVLRVERACPSFFEDLERLRDDAARNDELRLSHVQQLEQDATRIRAELGTLHRVSDRLAHSRHPESPSEFSAANSLRHDILDWISSVRALRREHEEWHARSLQVDIGGPG
jgi:hypothetical protein